jgi:hypothetical protein
MDFFHFLAVESRFLKVDLDKMTETFLTCRLNLGAEGIRLKEGGHINTSLMVLSKVIAKLSEPNLNVK